MSRRVLLTIGLVRTRRCRQEGIVSKKRQLLLRTICSILLCLMTIPLSTRTASAAVPSGFEDTFLTTVSGPTDLTWTPDGRMLIIGKDGQVRVYANNTLLPNPALDLSARLCTVGEQGLVGIAVHPQFATNHFIYLYYIYNKFNNACPESEIDGPIGRLSRFVLPDTNVIDPASEVVLFNTPPRYRNHHTGGDPKFGKDGYIYVTVGDAGAQSLGWPQDLGRLAGKIVRITDSGGIPADNPFTGAGTARCNVDGIPPSGSPAGTKCQEIYASGLRNPFRQAFDPNAAGVRFYINDVGQHTWEEISEGQLGANYGWQVREGPCAKDSDTDCGLPPAGMTDPVHWYHHGPDGGAVTGGAFVPNGIWPASYDGTYLFSDYVFGKIYQLVPNGGGCRLCGPPTSSFNQIEFAPIAQITSMRFGPYGTGQALYYVTRDGSAVRRIAFTGSSNRTPVASATANPTSGAVPLLVQFDGSASSDPDGDSLTYEWDFESDGNTDSTAVTVNHTYEQAGVYTAKLTVRDGKGGENSTTVRIDAGNRAPTATIGTPTADTLFAVGEHITLHGSATDPDDGPLPNSALTWQVILHHATHIHPFLEPTVGNDIEIVAPGPEDLDAARTSYLEIQLTATDSNGLTSTVTQELRPKFVDVTFQSSPVGLNLTVSGATFATPATVSSWEAANLTVSAPNQTDTSGQPWVFDTWSDGGAQMHTILTPPSTATYTATFKSGSTAPATGTFTPVADTYVKATSPSSNYGSATTLRTDASPDLHSYLRFNVQGLGTPLVRATLRVYASSGNSIGYGVYSVSDNSWGETTLTYNNAPPVGLVAGSSGRITAATWTEVDVTPLVSGNGLLSLAMISTSSTATTFASRESGATAPQLIVTTGSGGSDTSPPTPPSGLSATAVSANQVNLTWTASSDNVGVTSYDIIRDGAVIASIGAVTSYADTTVAPATAYSYQVQARDAAGNISDASAPANTTTPSVSALIFSDNFEGGDLSHWTSVNGLVVQQQEVFAGAYAARGTSSGAATYVYKQLSTPQSDLYYRIRFKVISQGNNSLRLLRFRTATDSSILGLFLSSSGKLGYTNYVVNINTTSSNVVSKGVWHEAQVRVSINGSASQTEVWLDGAPISTLSKTESLGTTSIGRIQLGDSSTGHSYDVAFDDVAVDSSFISP